MAKQTTNKVNKWYMKPMRPPKLTPGMSLVGDARYLDCEAPEAFVDQAVQQVERLSSYLVKDCYP